MRPNIVQSQAHDVGSNSLALGDGRFLFTLKIVHPRLGLLIRQSGAFRECQS
jgi:hypothetical protein